LLHDCFESHFISIQYYSIYENEYYIHAYMSEIDAFPSNTQIGRKLDGEDQIRFLIDFLFYIAHIASRWRMYW
jgi:hypothetical protein